MAAISNVDEFWAEVVKLGLADRHLCLMNQNWWPEPSWKALEPYAKLAFRVRNQSDLFLPLIEDPNWRFNLFGAAFAILTEDKSLLPALMKRLVESWAAPQVAAAVLILLGYEEYSDWKDKLSPLRELVMSTKEGANLKGVMSAYAVLYIRDKETAREFEKRPEFTKLWKSDSSWFAMTIAHYHHWTGVLPHLYDYAKNS